MTLVGAGTCIRCSSSRVSHGLIFADDQFNFYPAMISMPYDHLGLLPYNLNRLRFTWYSVEIKCKLRNAAFYIAPSASYYNAVICIACIEYAYVLVVCNT